MASRWPAGPFTSDLMSLSSSPGAYHLGDWVHLVDLQLFL